MTKVVVCSKTCSCCKCELLLSSFSRHKGRPDGRQYWCKECVRATAKESIATRMVKGARNRAAKLGLDFELTIQDVLELNTVQNGQCAISGKTLNWTELPRQPQAQRACPVDRASLDRIDPRKGYSKDNIQLVTDLANRIKGDASMNETIELCRAIVSHQRSLQQV